MSGLTAKIITGKWRRTLNDLDEREPVQLRRTMDDVASEIEILNREHVNLTAELHRIEECRSDKRRELADMVQSYGVKVVL